MQLIMLIYCHIRQDVRVGNEPDHSELEVYCAVLSALRFTKSGVLYVSGCLIACLVPETLFYSFEIIIFLSLFYADKILRKHLRQVGKRSHELPSLSGVSGEFQCSE